MNKEQILKSKGIQIERLKQEKPMLVHNILEAMDDYAKLSKQRELLIAFCKYLKEDGIAFNEGGFDFYIEVFESNL